MLFDKKEGKQSVMLKLIPYQPRIPQGAISKCEVQSQGADLEVTERPLHRQHWN